MNEDTGLNQSIKNIMSALTFVLVICVLIIVPFAVVSLFKSSKEADNENEKIFYKLTAWEFLFGGYGVYVFTVILILSNANDDWWIWSHFPTFWGMFYDWTGHNRMIAVLYDGVTSLLLMPVMGFWARRYGQLIDGVYLPK
jgi:hypothetical protein